MNLPDDVLANLVPPDAPADGDRVAPSMSGEMHCGAACCNPSFPSSFGPLYDVLDPRRAAEIDRDLAMRAAWREQTGEYYVIDDRVYNAYCRQYILTHPLEARA